MGLSFQILRPVFVTRPEALVLVFHAHFQPVLDQDDPGVDDRLFDGWRVFSRKYSTCSSVAKPITRSTPARLYQLRSKMHHLAGGGQIGHIALEVHL